MSFTSTVLRMTENLHKHTDYATLLCNHSYCHESGSQSL